MYLIFQAIQYQGKMQKLNFNTFYWNSHKLQDKLCQESITKHILHQQLELQIFPY